MPTQATTAATDGLAAKVAALRGTVAAHNAAIRRHRKARRDAQAALVDLERECHRRGITLILEPQHSEGAVHGTSGPDR